MNPTSVTRLLVSFILLICLSIPVNSQNHPKKKKTRDQMISDAYHGCGFDKHCLKIFHLLQPNCGKCISEYNCPAMVSTEVRDGKCFSQMVIQKLGLSHEYIAIGLSGDQYMGEDVAVIRVATVGPSDNPRHNRTFNMFGALTTLLKTVNYDIGGHEKQPIYDAKHEIIDEAYVCSFQWKIQFELAGMKFNIEDDNGFHLLGAWGEAASPWKISGHHKSEVARVVSEKKAEIFVVPELPDYDERFGDTGVFHNVSYPLLLICLVLTVTSLSGTITPLIVLI